MKTRETSQKRTVLSTALTAGAIIFTVNAAVYLAIIVGDIVQWLRVAQGAGSWGRPADLFHLPLMLLMAAAVSALPVGLWGCVLRRCAIAESLSVAPAPRGKHVPWGRSPRSSEVRGKKGAMSRAPTQNAPPP